MALIRHERLESDPLAYRVFGVTRDKSSWRAADVLRGARFTDDPKRTHHLWQLASRGYYAEQAGLVAAATLAAHTEDAGFRFGLALAAADEARHADALYQYARAIGGEPEDCAEIVQPLDDALTALPHMGRALVHTMLEGVAADEFLLLRRQLADDPLGRLYRLIRRDEVQHVAIGLTYLARASATSEGRQEWEAHADEWHAAGMRLIYLDAMARMHADDIGVSPAALESWFLRRHNDRLRAAGITLREEVNPSEDQEGRDQGGDPRHLQVLPAG
ncbi:MAG TPA: ferritin-like domain-containing protein [Pseudonocardiaceae bacterium]|jgi:1,2-phenylacetyl-CoA epoxidase catalytic subunit|nr:ferritin-like domain-containing protein [Pseudonocardiaceae bacterium]